MSEVVVAKHTISELKTLKAITKAELKVAQDICQTIGMLRDCENRKSLEYKCYHKAWEVANARRQQSQAQYDTYVAESKAVGRYPRKKVVSIEEIVVVQEIITVTQEEIQCM